MGSWVLTEEPGFHPVVHTEPLNSSREGDRHLPQ